MLDQQTCPLCLSGAERVKDDNYYSCLHCGALFLDKEDYVSREEEKERYESHNNDVSDERYRQFVSPITSVVLSEQPENSIGLDFGAGTGPVISVVLKEAGYDICQYDPFFFDNKELLKKEYDYIVCCEVVEHFKDPRKEFELLKKLLKPGGSLYIMTDMPRARTDFKNWYYRQDPTHVFIYNHKTFEYIKREFEFHSLNIAGRLVVLKKYL